MARVLGSRRGLWSGCPPSRGRFRHVIEPISWLLLHLRLRTHHRLAMVKMTPIAARIQNRPTIHLITSVLRAVRA